MKTYNASSTKLLRLAHNLSQSEFARKVGITRQQVHAFERQKAKPDVATLELIAGAFDLTMDFFFDDTIATSHSKEVTL